VTLSEPFIRRPVGTGLMALGLLLVGLVAYVFLPVASLPSVEFPTIRVSAARPGADPATMAATVAAPLERRLGAIAGVTEITSQSSLGTTQIAVQFELGRSVDKAARDVQAALNAAATDLPADLPTLPIFRKANPAAAPVLILALTSETLASSALYDAADTVVAQRISQVEGVADVNVSGAEQPAIRVRLDPDRLAAMGLSLERVRLAIMASSTLGPTGSFDGARRGMVITTNDQLVRPEEFGRVVVRSGDGTVVKLSDVATVEAGTRNSRAVGSYNGKPAVILTITKQGDANVVETVDRVRALLPELRGAIPPGIDIAMVSDRTLTIRASIADMQWTLAGSIALVMVVVFVFLRRATPTLAAGAAVPLSLAGTFACMWLCGFTLDNLSLMAITISVGFVVDDAIVVIEAIQRRREGGLGRIEAAIAGAREIGFTVISISLSLIAAFIPLFFMGGIIGRFFRDFSLTLAFAIVVSTIVSLTVAPAVMAHGRQRETSSRFGLAFESGLSAITRAYARTLGLALRHRWLMLVVTILTVVMTVQLFRAIPKGYFPQDDSGLVMAFTEAAADISFPAMVELQKRVADIALADPGVAGATSSAGSSGWSGSVNGGRLFISIRPGTRSAEVIGRLRPAFATVPGIRVYIFGLQDLRVGARQGNGQYQFTLWGPDLGELDVWAPRVLDRMRTIPGLIDVSSDRGTGGLQAMVEVDRAAASRLGIRIQDVNDALNNAFAQRQVSTIHTRRNQYRVVLEVGPERARDPEDVLRLHVSGAGGVQVPLAAVARIVRGTAPLVVNHQSGYPSVTITYNLSTGTSLDAAGRAITSAVGEMTLPDGVRAEFAGDARDFARGSGSSGLLLIGALVAVYIILGISTKAWSTRSPSSRPCRRPASARCWRST
jgi:multidrug efflux pump